MAIGGALRAAMKAGNWASAARESRRRARALAELNARGGIRGTGRMNASLERGIDDGTWARGPGGNEIFINPETGARRVPFDPWLIQMRRGSMPIQAPYEGMRVLPGRVDQWGDTMAQPGPWMGRGQGTDWAQGPVNGFDGSDGSYWFNASRYNLDGVDMDSSIPRALGGFGGQSQRNPFPSVAPPFSTSIRGTVPFDDIMSARGYIGNRYSRPAPPSPGPGYYWDPMRESWEIPF